jgi:hypothetical protein
MLRGVEWDGLVTEPLYFNQNLLNYTRRQRDIYLEAEFGSDH